MEAQQQASESTDPGALIGQARAILKKTFGFSMFRPGQDEVIEAALSGEDTLVIMPTGGGKSLCYQIPALLLPGATLVISPLISLMKDQVDALKVLDLPVCSINSLMSLTDQREVLAAIRGGAYKLIYASPERLRNPRFLETMAGCLISMCVVDEAHCISQWGHDFRPDYLRIAQAVQRLGRPRLMALTATATERVRHDIVTNLKMRTPSQFITGFDRPNLYWEVQHVSGKAEKVETIAKRLYGIEGGAIVYTGTRKNVESIVEALERKGVDVTGYHAGMEDHLRDQVQEKFMGGQKNVIVATNAFGMGIDRSDIRLVIHHTLPGSVEAFYQESGRAGRDGEPSTSLLLYSPGDRFLQEYFINQSYPSVETVRSIYETIAEQHQEVLWLTHKEIADLTPLKTTDMAVASALKILEEAAVVQRLRRFENYAELYLKVPAWKILKGLTARKTNRARLVSYLAEQFGEEELRAGIRFLPQDLAAETGVTKETLRRILGEMAAQGESNYIPPFRGRGVRLVERLPASDLPVDFKTLQLKKASELEKLNQIVSYATSGECRRQYLLLYFGDRLGPEGCAGCDACRGEARPIDAAHPDPLLAAKILSGVARVKGRFGKATVAKMLTGSKDKTLQMFGLERLSTYNLLHDSTQEQVQVWIDELIRAGCLVQQPLEVGERVYPVLVLTEWGRVVMTQRKQVPLSVPVPRPNDRSVSRDDRAPNPLARDAFQQLRVLRTDIAKSHHLPAYCIFQDRTLREMAEKMPETREEMLDIVGVGDVNFKKYGKRFLGLIKALRSGHSQTASVHEG